MKTTLSYAYTAYGYTGHRSTNQTLLGFNGELSDPLTGLYILGSGYRPYSVILMRFIATDSLAPFGIGGMNTYSYTNGDPINYTDPSGHFNVRKMIAKRLNLEPPTREQILMKLDRPAQLSTPDRRDAPPYYSFHSDAFSSPVSPPSYDPGKLPSYSRRLPSGHTRIMTPTLNSSGKFAKLAAPPKYNEQLSKPKVRTQLPPYQVASYQAELQEEQARYRRIRTVVNTLERHNMYVPEEYRQNLSEIRRNRDNIRDLLGI
ncbi:RHS repeat-associated core domain-containing protein [Pseudomonas sp. 10-1B]|uniref:RHS repeat-associated core domain-containing protein n=1 Tax=Pseudomonas sp. 10-1B TaxID=1546029 RepID=UPI0009E36D43|nr:RHS repeat-associated core domain-containing protein [Pseudomonas sp. 10-1B]